MPRPPTFACCQPAWWALGARIIAVPAKAGVGVLNAASLEKTILFIVLSPLLGMALGFALILANMWLFRRRALLRCADSGLVEAATSVLDHIAKASSSSATATRQFAGSSAANS